MVFFYFSNGIITVLNIAEITPHTIITKIM